MVDVVVVGAGPGGLACAIALRRLGREPLVIEAADHVGGRVWTDEVDGHLLDRGFQVVNTAYPALRRYAPPRLLDLRPLPAATSVVWEGGLHPLGKPWAGPAVLAGSLRPPFASARDLLALGSVVARLLPSNRVALGPDHADAPARAWLLGQGLSPRFIDAFLRPFFAGVLLDRELASSARSLRYDLRQFVVGGTALPARGMRALPELMARRVGATRIRLRAEAVGLLRSDAGAVAGVRLAGGEELRAAAVCVATAAPAAARLSGRPLPAEGTGEVAVWLGVDRPVLPGGRLLLDPSPGALFLNAVEPSASAATYAPPGRALVGLVAPGVVGTDNLGTEVLRAGLRDEPDWEAAALDALHRWFPRLPAAAARILRVDRIPFGLLRQPPLIHAQSRRFAHPEPGLAIGGEATVAASLQGALLGGERAAQALHADLAAADAGAGRGTSRDGPSAAPCAHSPALRLAER